MPRVSWAHCRPSAMTVRCGPSHSTTPSARCRPPRRWPPPRRRSTRRSRRLGRGLRSCGAGWNPAAGWQPATYAGKQPARSLPSCPTKEHILTVADLQLSHSLQGPIDALDSIELRFPERLRFHLLQVGMGISESRPDLFLVGEQPLLFRARAHIQDVHLTAAAEHALEPAI